MRRPDLSTVLPPPTQRAGALRALALGLTGGWLASLIGLPLPWMLGPMLVTAAASLARAPLAAPISLRPVVIPVIGVMLGSAFSPALLDRLTGWIGTFLLLPPFLLVAGAAAWIVFRHVGGYDGRTAFFCAAPGGLNEMIILGEEAGADARRISMAHAVRVFTAVTVIAFGFSILEGTTTAGLAGGHTGFLDLTWLDGLALLACALFGGPLAQRLHLPAPGLFGPMVLSAALHLAGLVAVPPPTLLVIGAQVVIGTTLGCRFLGASLRETGRDLMVGVLAALVLIGVGVVFAALVWGLTPTPFSQAVLAYAPGGLAEMSLLALAKQQDVAYVATAHVARIVVVIVAVVPVYRALARRLSAPKIDSSATEPSE